MKNNYYDKINILHHYNSTTQMDELFIDNILSLRANPDYYDYCHMIELNRSAQIFYIQNGGCQHMDDAYSGDYEIVDDKLILCFKYVMDVETYKYKKIEDEYINEITYQIKKEELFFFNGYCKQSSQYTITFDKPLLSSHDAPLRFHSDFKDIECNVKLERFISHRNEFFSNKKTKDLYGLMMDVSVDNLVKILELQTKYFTYKANRSLYHVKWINNLFDKILLDHRDTHTTILIDIDNIEFYKYGYVKDDNLRKHNMIFSKESVRMLSDGTDEDTELVFDNLQNFYIEVLHIFLDL